ncbi:MAG: lysophospholipid acyltransferase family protein [Lentisphaerae bacterium]|nr:lysophospholipid acyltransferase family protein [Lentisphaerota bacterium]
MRYRTKHLVEYGALRALAGLVNALPYRAALAIGWGVARLGYLLFRPRVREAKRRIRSVFGDGPNAPDPARIAWLSWRNLAFDIVEILRIAKATPAWLRTTTNSDDVIAPVLAHARTGQGAIIAVPHMGNWETAALACHHAGIPIFSIAATQKNPLVDDYLNRLRRQPGIHTLARGSGLMRDVLRRLLDGGFLAILPDVRVRTPDISAPFLGGVANVGSGMARFARQAEIPIFACLVLRQGWTQQRMHVSPPIWPDPSLPRQVDIERMTRDVLQRIDNWIRASPDQWFWFNRRWILDPLEPDAATVENASTQQAHAAAAEPTP